MNSKVNSIIISSLLAFALIATAGISTTTFVNVVAQEGAITPEGTINDTMSGQNASEWASNATLAFAQEGLQTEDLVNETIDIGNNTATSNATLAFAQGEGNTTAAGGNATQGQMGGNMTGTTQGQTDEDSDDDGNDGDKDDGDTEEDDKDEEQ